jgi:hypothetical protein
MVNSLWDKIEQRTRVPVHIFNIAIDDLSAALITIDFPHHEVHEGHAYECSVYDASVPDGTTLILGITMPADVSAHLAYDGGAGGDATLEFLEGPTFAGGSAQPVYNLNRNYPDSSVAALLDPTLGGAPTTLQATFLPGGAGPQAQGTVVSPRAGLEWITRPATTYAIRLTNVSGQAQPANIRIAFYIPD